MGAAFRKKTIKTETAWKSRHLKWVLTSLYFTLFLFVLLPFSKTKPAIDAFFGVVGVIYFTSFLFIPLTGNRNWCRWLCPYGQTFGVLNKVGFYKIKADREKCISCGKCTKECDMGIPVQQLVETKGEVNVPDCVGCGRCVTNCPKGVLEFYDVRGLFKKSVPSISPAFQAEPEKEEVSSLVALGSSPKEGHGVIAVVKSPSRGELVVTKKRNKLTSDHVDEEIPVKMRKGATL
jgi:polyferredoxin